MGFSRDRVVFVAGHGGMVGSAIVRRLESAGYRNIVVAERSALDLTSTVQVMDFYSNHRIDAVIVAAAKVGGIHANDTYPADFIYQNLMIEANLIHGAHLHDVQDVLFLGSSCIYPRDAAQPLAEDSLLTGKLEATNEAYAIAKIAGIKLCESYSRQYGRDYRSLMPTNLYGPGDNFHPQDSHVIPALMARFHEAAESAAESVTVWGSGRPMREFLHVDDLAAACVHVMELPAERWRSITHPRQSHVNVGTGVDCSIRELAETLARIVGFRGRILFDDGKPDGTPRKLLDVSRIVQSGWTPTIPLEDGLRSTYEWFLSTQGHLRIREAMTGRWPDNGRHLPP